MRFLDRALMSAQQPPLGQRGDPVHRRWQLARVVTAGARRMLAAPLVDVAEPGQPTCGDGRVPGAGMPWMVRVVIRPWPRSVAELPWEYLLERDMALSLHGIKAFTKVSTVTFPPC
jgi:hypothetical protein